MGRKILAIIVAMITAVAIIWIGYMIGTMIAPDTPKNAAYESQISYAAYMQTFPVAAFVAVIAGYALAAFAGGFISTKMGRRWSSGATLALIVGVLLTLGELVIANFWPQPVWFIIVSLFIFIPVSILGYRFAR